MSHYAELNPSGVVLRVIVADAAFIAGMLGTWMQTSYNTEAGAHKGVGAPIRKNFAGVGFTYDAVRDAFIASRPTNSTGFNEATCQWIVPVVTP